MHPTCLSIIFNNDYFSINTFYNYSSHKLACFFPLKLKLLQ